MTLLAGTHVRRRGDEIQTTWIAVVVGLGASSRTFSRGVGASISSVAAFSTPGSPTGRVGAVGNTPAPNNDNHQGASPNGIPYSCFFNTPGILETEFALTTSGATTEYRLTQSFFNNTDMTRAGFRFDWDFGTGANFLYRSSSIRSDSTRSKDTRTQVSLRSR